MPWKLVAFIAVMSIVLVFVGFNLTLEIQFC